MADSKEMINLLQILLDKDDKFAKGFKDTIFSKFVKLINDNISVDKIPVNTKKIEKALNDKIVSSIENDKNIVTIVSDLSDKLKKSIKIDSSKPFTLNSLFADKTTAVYTLKYNKLLNNTIVNLEKQFSKSNFDKLKLNVGSLFNLDQKLVDTNKTKMKDIQNRLSEVLDKKITTIDTESFDLSPDKKKTPSIVANKKPEKENKLALKAEKFVKPIEPPPLPSKKIAYPVKPPPIPVSKSSIVPFVSNPVNKIEKPTGKSVTREMDRMEIGKFSEDALRQITKILPVYKFKEKADKKKEDGGGSMGLLAKLGLLGLGLLGGGLLAQIASIFSDGPFKGLTKAVGNIMTRIGGFILTKFGPFLATHIQDVFHSITKGFAGLFKGLGVSATKTVLKVGKTASGGLLKLAGSFIKPILTKLPVIGFMLGIGSAISRIIKGDFIGGMLDVASGIASFFPGPGTAISIAIDLFSAARDIKTGGSAKSGKSGANLKIGKFIENLEDVPGIGWLFKISKGFAALFEGNWKVAGLYLAGMIPGLNFIFDKTTMETIQSDNSGRNFGDIVKDALKTKFKTLLKNLPGFIKNPIYSMLGISEEPDKDANSSIGASEGMSKEKAEIVKKRQIEKEARWKKEDASKTDSSEKSRGAIGKRTGPAYDPSKKVSKENPDEYGLYPLTDSSRSAQAYEAKRKLVAKEQQPPMNDFIWRSDSKTAQPFNKNDNIFATKDNKVFDDILNVLKSDKGSQESPNMDKISRSIAELTTMMQSFITHSAAGANKPQRPMEGLPPIASDAGDIRSPAYSLRQRVYERNNGNFVIF